MTRQMPRDRLAESVRVAGSHNGTATPLQAVEGPAIAREPYRVVVIGAAFGPQGVESPGELIPGDLPTEGDTDDNTFDLYVEQFLSDREADIAASGARRIGEPRRLDPLLGAGLARQ